MGSNGLIAQKLPTYRVDKVALNFDGGQPLPAGNEFLIEGALEKGATRIELEIYHRKKKKRNLKYKAVWKAAKYFESDEFTIPVTEKLKNKKNYDVVFRFYGPVFEARQRMLRAKMVDTIFVTFTKDIEWEMEQDAFSPTTVTNKILKLEQYLKHHMEEFAGERTEEFHGFEGKLNREMFELNGLIEIYREHHDTPDYPGQTNPRDDVDETIHNHLRMIRGKTSSLADTYFDDHLVAKLEEFTIGNYPASLSWHVEH